MLKICKLCVRLKKLCPRYSLIIFFFDASFVHCRCICPGTVNKCPPHAPVHRSNHRLLVVEASKKLPIQQAVMSPPPLSISLSLSFFLSFVSCSCLTAHVIVRVSFSICLCQCVCVWWGEVYSSNSYFPKEMCKHTCTSVALFPSLEV